MSMVNKRITEHSEEAIVMDPNRNRGMNFLEGDKKIQQCLARAIGYATCASLQAVCEWVEVTISLAGVAMR